MELRPTTQIRTVIKALTDVILPALDPDNKLAQEQARLSIGMLSLVVERLPLSYRYDRDELARFLDLAKSLQSQVGVSAGVEVLAASAVHGTDVLARAGAEPDELEAANFDLREKIGAVITAAYQGTDAAGLKALNETVLAHAETQLVRERAWVVTQGWEPDPAALPKIETLIGEKPK